MLLRILTVLLATASPLCADVELPKIFGDRMVLQRDKYVRIWGRAEAGEKVRVAFAGEMVRTCADGNGAWGVYLGPLKASAEGRDLVVTGEGNKITLKDVLVGEVWICGGQSNMEWTLRGSRDADIEMASADFPEIRFIRLPKIARLEPQTDFPVKSPTSSEGNWRRCITEEVENCTAVGYYFGRRLHRRLKVPVGLIDTSWGGTMAQHWVRRETLRPIAEMKPYFDKFETRLKEWIDGGGEEGAERRFKEDVQKWEKERAKARAEGKREPRRPNQNSYRNPAHQRQPGGMMNGVIAPIASLTVRGVIFYQGENNSFTVGWKPFPKTFPAVISDWRKVFTDESLPFGLIQIAGWSNRRSMTYDMNHHCNIVREVQFNTWRSTPWTGLIVTFDTNVGQGIHPPRKMPVGERTARWALAEVYKVGPIEWRGPVYRSMKVKDGKIMITFEEGTHRGLVLDQDVEVGFYIAGEDRKFHHARARVNRGDNSLVVWSDEVPKPVAVRYGWSNLPAGGLMNRRELPAYPFRTDTWPLTPHQSTGSYEVREN